MLPRTIASLVPRFMIKIATRGAAIPDSIMDRAEAPDAQPLPQPNSFDVIVIGAGPAGIIAAGMAAAFFVLLAKLPADWIDDLRDAVLYGQKDRLDQLIHRVEDLDARAARSLQEVADRYDYDVLGRWFEEAAETRTERPEERI